MMSKTDPVVPVMEDVSPFFSVIVPVYNVETYLAECIDSILNQTFNDFELLLIDDGSTDRSSDICKRYLQDKRIKLLHQANSGVSAARNLGIDHATGKWICFVDSDDYINPDFLTGFYNQGLLEENCLNLQGWQIVSNINHALLRSYEFPDLLIDHENIRQQVGIYRFFDNNTPWAKLYNRDVLNRHHIRFRKDLTVREDIVFVYTYRMQISQIKLIPTTAYCYRQAENRVTLSHNTLHPYPIFLLLRQELPPLIKDTLLKFGILDTDYAKHIYSFNKNTTCISLVKSLYVNKTGRKERWGTLRIALGDKAYFNDPYFHQNTTLKVLKSMQRILSVPVFDFLCNSLLRTYYRHSSK